jgi:hypothetical protein
MSGGAGSVCGAGAPAWGARMTADGVDVASDGAGTVAGSVGAAAEPSVIRSPPSGADGSAGVASTEASGTTGLSSAAGSTGTARSAGGLGTADMDDGLRKAGGSKGLAGDGCLGRGVGSGATPRSYAPGLMSASAIFGSPCSPRVFATLPVSLLTCIGRRGDKGAPGSCSDASFEIGAVGRRCDFLDGVCFSLLDCRSMGCTSAFSAGGGSSAHTRPHREVMKMNGRARAGCAQAGSGRAGRGRFASRCAPAIECSRIVSSSADSRMGWRLHAPRIHLRRCS